MIEEYQDYVKNSISKLGQYYAAGKVMGLIGVDCVLTKMCEMNIVVKELGTLDEAVPDDLDYFEEIKYYVGKLEGCLDLGKILTIIIAIHPDIPISLNDFQLGDLMSLGANQYSMFNETLYINNI